MTSPQPGPRTAVLVEAIRRRQRPYRSSHPLAIPRTALAFDLLRACGALDDDEVVMRDAVLRLREALQRHPFIDPGAGASYGPCMRSTRAG